MSPSNCPLRSLIASLLALSLLLVGASSARADKIDVMIKKLIKSSDYKVRLSAALSLAKLRDQRSVPAFLKALRDSDKTVRGVAAASLGKIVNTSTKAKLRKSVLAALRRRAAKDSNAFVKKQAQKAYDRLKSLKKAPSRRGGATYVNIGAMSADVANAGKLRNLMRRTVERTFKKKARSMMTEIPGARNPSDKQLAKRRVQQAFHVDGTLNELTSRASGGTTTVSCKVSMLLATYEPETGANGKVDVKKSMFGFLKGGAKVQAGSSPKEVGYAKEDCVAAVIEDLIARKIIPTIEARTN